MPLICMIKDKFFQFIQGSPSEMTLGFRRDIEAICPHPKLLHAKLYGSRVFLRRLPLHGSKIRFYSP